jgi:serine/threonine protein kinase
MPAAMQGGSLAKVVASQMSSPHTSVYSELEGLTYALDVAHALAYLHEQSPPIIHR